MITLRSLLLETEASEKAKMLGLKHIGFGKYVKPSNPKQVVARVVKGKLVAVYPKSYKPPQKAKTKDKATKAVQPERNPKEVEGDVTLDDFNDETDPLGIIRHAVIRGEKTIVHHSIPWALDETVKDPETMASVLLYNFLVGNVTMYSGLTVEKWKAKYGENSEPPPFLTDVAKLTSKVLAAQKFSENDSFHQHADWRYKLSDEDYTALAEVQAVWQQDSTYNSPDKSWRNSTINRVCGDNPPIAHVPPSTGCVERGMVIPAADAEEFLSYFGVGKDIVLPPGGFSSDLKVARGFAKVLFGQSSLKEVGVLLRLKPKKGDNSIVGVQLTGQIDLPPEVQEEIDQLDNEEPQFDEDAARESFEMDNPYPEDGTSDEQEQWQSDLDEYMDAAQSDFDLEHDDWEDERRRITETWEGFSTGEYDYERELIRPGTVKQKVLSVTKHVFPTKLRYTASPDIQTGVKAGRVLYVIEIEEGGPVSPAMYAEQIYYRSLEEGKKWSDVKKIILKYFSTRVAQTNRKPKK